MERTKHPSLDFPGHRRHRFVTTREGARVLNRVTTPWWNALPPRGFGVLTTRGRRTGKESRTSVRVHRSGDRAYLVAITGTEAFWLHNVRADPSVRIRLKGGTFEGTAREIVDPAEKEAARRIYCDAVKLGDRFEGLLHLTGLPTRSKIKDLHERWFRKGIPVVIELRSPLAP